ncbi:hypothetical protein RHSIM_Rhsim06G0083400 [Rhododendron simsii]|uniref:Thioredoxin domain-containing protein n=1 Tax=Rhododendron simsii TaxID=118357 RepID=A0A834H2X5_RHOSS|nr:hypothetical protein RHSIM_Rhsim06G0083400 [Rhododendron simsii]
MAETANYPVKNEVGCGFITSIFNRKRYLKTLPKTSDRTSANRPSTQIITEERSDGVNSVNPPAEVHAKPSPNPPAANSMPSNFVHQNQKARPSDASRSSTSSSNNSGPKRASKAPEAENLRVMKRVPTYTSTELSLVPVEPRKSDSSASLIRTSSGKKILIGQLGNLKPPARRNPPLMSKGPALVTKLDPEVVKSMGNEKYKQGRFEEALALYDRAISLDSSKASYHSNKSAALIGLGRLIEAAVECSEAVRIEPSYLRAHFRLATLYLRLGEPEKALHHYEHSGLNANTKEIANAEALKTHLNECSKAIELGDWNSLLKESRSAVVFGADSAPQINAMQVHALLKLHRHQEAQNLFQKAPKFNIDSCTRFFGRAYGAYLLTIQAQIHMVVGRFEDALASSKQAVRLDSSEKVTAVLKRAEAMVLARSNGNHLFKASRFSEASAAYSEGLDHDAYNAILLCNRAACLSKLGLFEKGAEDCTVALNVQPSYSKARLRRANCNAKLERWEAAIQDYEVLIRETPGDEEVGKALFEARIQLKKQCGEEDTKDMKFGSNLVIISSNESFRHFVTAPGMSVVLFCDKIRHKNVFQLMEQVCKGFPSVNFLKVEIEDHPYLAKSEGVSSIPAFKIYKNGSKVKDIIGNNRELLESSVKLYSS